MADRTGDILLGMLDRPAEAVDGRPLVLLVHGCTGSEDSAYMLNAARHLLARGYTVLRYSYAQVIYGWESVERTLAEAISRGLHLGPAVQHRA